LVDVVPKFGEVIRIDFPVVRNKRYMKSRFEANYLTIEIAIARPAAPPDLMVYQASNMKADSALV
jgi:hypothetical protein